jgi:hypothetical protein
MFVMESTKAMMVSGLLSARSLVWLWLLKVLAAGSAWQSLLRSTVTVGRPVLCATGALVCGSVTVNRVYRD